MINPGMRHLPRYVRMHPLRGGGDPGKQREATAMHDLAMRDDTDLVTHDEAVGAGDGRQQLTYRALAERLGLSLGGARALVKRKGWPVLHDAGRMLVIVDEAELAREAERRANEEADTRAMAARVAALIGAIKADETRASATPPSADPGEHARLIQLMRDFVATYERERAAWLSAIERLTAEKEEAREELHALTAERERERLDWQERIERLEAAAIDARAMAAAVKAEHQQAVQQHQRALADLTTMHNDQRSLWLLDRRRLEVTIEALEAKRRRRWFSLGRRSYGRLRAAAALMLVGLAGLGLTRDTRPLAIEHRRDDADRTDYWSVAALHPRADAAAQTRDVEAAKP
jgi:hypothetical protein